MSLVISERKGVVKTLGNHLLSAYTRLGLGLSVVLSPGQISGTEQKYLGLVFALPQGSRILSWLCVFACMQVRL